MSGEVLNFSVPNFTLTIGSVDFTACVASLSLARPLPDFGSPYSWTGTISLNTPLDPGELPESLDDLDNAARWSKGLQPIVFSVEGTPLAVVRILEYYFDPDNGTAEMSVGDLLTLLNFRKPPQGVESLGFDVTSPLPIQALAEFVLGTVLDLNFDLDLPGVLRVAPSKPSGSYIQWLQGYLGERGLWLYVDPTETIRAAEFPRRATQASVLFSKPRRQVETFQRQRSPEVPAEKIVVSGTYDDFVKCSRPDNPVEVGYALFTIEDGDTTTVAYRVARITTRQVEEKTLTRYRERAITQTALGVLFPDSFPGNTSLIESENTLLTRFADSQGFVKTQTTETVKPFAVAVPEVYPPVDDDGNAILANLRGKTLAETTTEVFSSRLFSNAISAEDNVVRENTAQTDKLVPVYDDEGEPTGTQTLTASLVQKTWDNGNLLTFGEQTASCQHYEFRQNTYSLEQLDSISALVLTNSQTLPGQSPPQFATLEPSHSVASLPLKSELRVAPVGVTPFVEQEFNYSFNTLQNAAEADNLAELIAIQQQGSYRARSFNAPMVAEWLANPSPFAVARVHDGIFALTNDVITLTNGELEVAWQGYWLGKIPPLQTPSDEWSEPVYPIRQTQPLSLNVGFALVSREGNPAGDDGKLSIEVGFRVVIVDPLSVEVGIDFELIETLRESIEIDVGFDFAVSESVPPNPALVHVWTFESPDYLNDKIGTSHLTLSSGTATQVTGAIGSALQLDYISDPGVLSTPRVTSLGLGGVSFVMAMWLKWRYEYGIRCLAGVLDGATATYEFAMGTDSSEGTPILALFSNGSFDFTPGVNPAFDLASGVSLGDWIHLIFENDLTANVSKWTVFNQATNEELIRSGVSLTVANTTADFEVYAPDIAIVDGIHLYRGYGSLSAGEKAALRSSEYPF
ncbi:MAG TPA: hypothetical protein IGS53_12705 [Leptolyngbyaceae cyanobacterium M33_DOE_097]|uniref:Uncharacterized protein n=1 Tax=Oscillatoriales cyanobacterium SpSt-418 TaxID=2282169 RepID=A0A7C3PH21_9CYAN|nr:hypothetical protein [Leptolyngbyaceae cyanobacterium M33_DOE_097]